MCTTNRVQSGVYIALPIAFRPREARVLEAGVEGAGEGVFVGGALDRALSFFSLLKREVKSPCFCAVRRLSAPIGAVRKCSSHARTIHAEVVEGEGEAQSWRLRVLR